MKNTIYIAMLAAVGLVVGGCGDPLPDNQPEYQAYEPTQPEPLDCVPNLDGRIQPSELTPQVGVPVRFLVSPAAQTRSVDLEGRTLSSGRRVWDWSEQIPTDREAIIEAEPVQEQWFADSFPSGAFVVPFDLGESTKAVYTRDEQALRLHGIASAQQDPPEGRTLLTYETPVELYRFPIEPGKQWVSTGVVNDATVRGVPYAGRDIYEVEVAAIGELMLPNITFDEAHKVNTKVTIQPAAGQSVTSRQTSFLFECFGEVARATSQEGEENPNFETATEVRRFGFE
ncbi:MAG: hypothetical protein ACQEVA_14855 [Myxococcota bacterium]